LSQFRLGRTYLTAFEISVVLFRIITEFIKRACETGRGKFFVELFPEEVTESLSENRKHLNEQLKQHLPKTDGFQTVLYYQGKDNISLLERLNN